MERRLRAEAGEFAMSAYARHARMPSTHVSWSAPLAAWR